MNKKIILLLIFSLILSCNPKEKFSRVFELIFIGNLNANLEACHCSDPQLGGLDNILPFIKQKRQLNPDIIVIDGGDIFNFYSFPQLNNFVARAYKIINPDIIVPGDQEFTEGIDFFKKFAAGSKSILLSNAGINGLTTIVQKSYHINNEKRVTINALLEPSIVDSLSAFLTKQTEQFNSLANSLAEEDFNILVFHGTEKYFKENQQVFNNYDLILSAHQVNSIIDTLEVPYHINATTDGESLFYIQLLNSGNSYQIKVEKIDIFKAEYPDKAIEKLIDEYRKMLINL